MFWIASTSKLVTSVVALTLVAEGRRWYVFRVQILGVHRSDVQCEIMS